MQGHTRNDKRPLEARRRSAFSQVTGGDAPPDGRRRAVGPGARASDGAPPSAMSPTASSSNSGRGPGRSPERCWSGASRGAAWCSSNTIRASAACWRAASRRRRVIQGDAYDLPRTLAGFAGQRIAAVVSSLPLLNQPPRRREKLIGDAFDLMGPDGVFVQFTYGLLSPIPREACAGRYSAHCGAPIWRNLPPARVWTYRLDAHAGRAESARGGPQARGRAAQAGLRGKEGASEPRRSNGAVRSCAIAWRSTPPMLCASSGAAGPARALRRKDDR